MKITRTLFSPILTCALLLGTSGVAVQAADEKPAKANQAQKKQAQPANPTGQILALPAKLELTTIQEEQIAKIREKFTADAKELQAKMNAAQPASFKKVQAEIMKEARAAGKERKDVQDQLKAAENELTAAEREKLKEVRSEVEEFRKKFLVAVAEVLTDEQKAQVPALKNAVKKSNDTPKKKKAADKT